MNRINDLRAEWVRARAYRITVWAWPVMALAALGFAAFGVLAIRDALAAGSTVVSQVETLAYLPGGASGVNGLLVAILATTLVTADESSGTARQLRMVVSDTRLLASRLSVVVLLAVAATVVSAAAGLGVAAATLPSALLVATLASTVLWVNILGTLLVHATWGLLAFAAASLVPRSAVALGLVLAIVLGAPMLEMSLRALSWDTRALAFLPEALMRAATVTGSEAVTTVAPLAAVGLLVGWCLALAALAGVGTRRLRTA